MNQSNGRLIFALDEPDLDKAVLQVKILKGKEPMQKIVKDIEKVLTLRSLEKSQ